MIGIQNPNSTDKEFGSWDPVSTAWNLRMEFGFFDLIFKEVG